jgi:hypothetical protein
MKKILIIGNDPSIDQIDFTRLDPSIITVGTNRAWMKLLPNYLFFHDPKIFQELEKNPKRLDDLKSHSKIIASDWLKQTCRNAKVAVPDYLQVYQRPNKRKYVDCVTTALDILDRNLFSKRDVVFYIAGVSLTWKSPSHFWKKNPIEGIGNTKDKDWYDKRFDLTYKNFLDLKSRGFKMVSVTPDSRLNKLLRYENVGNLYR